jgi:hypothetical protein
LWISFLFFLSYSSNSFVVLLEFESEGFEHLCGVLAIAFGAYRRRTKKICMPVLFSAGVQNFRGTSGAQVPPAQRNSGDSKDGAS